MSLMHELSIMESVMDTVRKSADELNIHHIEKIKLVIGKMTMALPESLQFAFQALARDELFSGAVLEIEERNIRCRCSGCQNEFAIESAYRFVCPGCGSREVGMIQGNELYIDSYEGDED